MRRLNVHVVRLSAIVSLSPSRTRSRFLWQVVMDTLSNEIRSGVFTSGQKMPSERELASRFGVNVNTVRRAISELQALGFVRGKRGSGCYVREDVFRYPVAERQQQNQALLKLQRTSRRQVLGAQTARSSDEVAHGLGISPGAYIRRVDTLTWVDDRPFSLTTYYFPLPRFHGIDEKIAKYGSITQALKDLGVSDYRRLQSVISPRMLSVKEAALLHQKRNSPSLSVVNLNVDPDGIPIQFSVSIEAAWVELVVRFDQMTISKQSFSSDEDSNDR